jgi:hypothetical protein
VCRFGQLQSRDVAVLSRPSPQFCIGLLFGSVITFIFLQFFSPSSAGFSVHCGYISSPMACSFHAFSVKKRKKTTGQKATTALGLPGPVAICCNYLNCFPLFLRVCFEEIPLAYRCLHCLVFKWSFVCVFNPHWGISL